MPVSNRCNELVNLILDATRAGQLSAADLSYLEANCRHMAKIQAKRDLAKDGIAVGSRVTFTGRGGASVEGMVIKIVGKRAEVDAAGIRWKVPPSMLTKVAG